MDVSNRANVNLVERNFNPTNKSLLNQTIPVYMNPSSPPFIDAGRYGESLAFGWKTGWQAHGECWTLRLTPKS